MRILFISHSSPLKEGGAETRTREVAFRLAKSGHQVTILCGKTNAEDPDERVVNGVTIITRKTLPDWLLKRYPYPHYLSLAAANLFLMFPVFFFLRRRKFDLIREDVAPFPPSFLLSLRRLPAHRVAVVHMLPKALGDWVKYYGTVFGTAGFLMNRLLRAGILKYDRIVCAASWFADELKESPKIAARVHYVPNGVALESYGRQPSRAANGQVRLLSVGRLVETKGHRYLVEAMSFLRQTRPDVKLDILGNGPLRESLMRLAKEVGVERMVEICPPVSYEKMPELLGEYDYFVMPSLWEGLPISLIEAMASRLPIIATDIPAITAILDEASAVFARRENAEDLADKLQWAFQHREETARRAEFAYQIARQYDWERTARQEIEGATC